MVVGISRETRLALRSAIARAIRDGIPPVEAARMIRSMIGMTQRQAMATMNYRESLIELGHAPARVAALVDKYAARKIRERALVIARTEVMGALNAGQVAAWRDAQAKGLLSAGAMKEWITTDDERLCSICEAVDGETVALDEPFSEDGPPAHPSCRCTIALARAK
ncbi:MAG TPA: phage minor head protein [Vicinamibacteria bacterium]|nr:phage minor head protein [Vicinamibacteria bacterium]